MAGTKTQHTYDQPFDLIHAEVGEYNSPEAALDASGIELDRLPEELRPATIDEAMTIINAAGLAHWATDGDENWGNLHIDGDEVAVRYWVGLYRQIEAGDASPEAFIGESAYSR